MQLAPGQSVGHYRVVEKLGEGGMGVVWKALDTRLQREVALKFLPPDFARDPERLARFEHEAKVLASLSHPHIASIHGLEDGGGSPFLVMELVGGQTLAQRLLAGPLALDEALGLARQIAEAMEAAHARGVVHRDLKPANVKIAPDGKVKLLDFGLAKALEQTPTGFDPAGSPTMTAGVTQAGAILGTAAYMSPEQAHGRPVDRRADVWAFGCVLFEMLAGKRTFSGESVPGVLAAVLNETPDWDALPSDVPAAVKRVLRRCLQKDPVRRLRDFGDVGLELDEASIEEASSPAARAPTPVRNVKSLVGALAWITLLVMVVAVAWNQLRDRSTEATAQPARRFSIELPAQTPLALAAATGVVAISPDDSRIVYAVERDGTTQLYERELDAFESRPIPGTEGGSGPFFSPDSKWIGFFAGGELKRILLGGGTPAESIYFFGGRGAAWLSDGTIVYPPSPSIGLARIPASGGVPQEITFLAEGEFTHRWPVALPGERAILYTVGHSLARDDFTTAVLTLDDGQSRALLDEARNASYVSSGHLVFERSGTLMAVPFEADSLEVTGDPLPVLSDVHRRSYGPSNFAVSPQGNLAYVPQNGVVLARSVTWVTRDGRESAIAELQPFEWVRLSPGGDRIVGWLTEPFFRLTTYTENGGSFSPLTFEGEQPFTPVWTPDGKEIIYSVLAGEGRVDLVRRMADGTGEAEPLFGEPQQACFASAVSPDGKLLAFTRMALHKPQASIWILSLEDRSVAPLFGEEDADLGSPRRRYNSGGEFGAAFSPDGHWVAYTSDETGSPEIYVHPFPIRGGRRQVSTAGGAFPLWSHDGRELFFRHGGEMWVARVSTEPTFSAGRPELLFEGDYVDSPYSWVGPNYSVSPDGRRFLLIRNDQHRVPTRVNVVLNWDEELRGLAP